MNAIGDLPKEPSTRLVGLLDRVERGLILVLYAWLVARVLGHFGDGSPVINGLLLASEGLVLAFTIIRRRPTAISVRPADWLLAFSATAAPFLVRPVSGPGLVPPAAAAALMLAGMFVQLRAKVELGRSFGCVAALRGVKLGGPYRFVRHPVYCGYLLTHLAFLLANPSPWNAAMYAVAYALQIPRLLAEERVLSADPAYRGYLRDVRYRLIPGLF